MSDYREFELHVGNLIANYESLFPGGQYTVVIFNENGDTVFQGNEYIPFTMPLFDVQISDPPSEQLMLDMPIYEEVP